LEAYIDGDKAVIEQAKKDIKTVEEMFMNAPTSELANSRNYIKYLERHKDKKPKSLPEFFTTTDYVRNGNTWKATRRQERSRS
jgi:rubrerythrin